jgi:ATP-binding cassette subfamily B protein
LTAYAIDDVIRPGKAELLMPVMLGLIGAFLLRDLFNSFRILVNNHFEQNVIFDMRREVFARLQRLPVNYFDQRASGDLMTRVIEDVNSVERVLIDGTEQGTVALVGVFGVGAILFYQNPRSRSWLIRRFRFSRAARSGTRSRRTRVTARNARLPAP